MPSRDIVLDLPLRITRAANQQRTYHYCYDYHRKVKDLHLEGMTTFVYPALMGFITACSIPIRLCPCPSSVLVLHLSFPHGSVIPPEYFFSIPPSTLFPCEGRCEGCFRRMRESILLVSCDFRPEIMPLWVTLFNQAHLPLAVPLLDLLLAVDCLTHVAVEFVVDQAVNAVPLRESICEVVSVFVDASRKITGHPGVQRPVEPAGQNVDGRLFCRHISPFLSFPRMRESILGSTHRFPPSRERRRGNDEKNPGACTTRAQLPADPKAKTGAMKQTPATSFICSGRLALRARNPDLSGSRFELTRH